VTPARGPTTAGRLLRLLLPGVRRLRLSVLLLLALLVLLLAVEAAVPAAWYAAAVRRRLHHMLREGHRPTWVHHHWGHRRVWPLRPSLLVVCRAVVAPRTTLRRPDAWWGPLQLHNPTSAARRRARLLLSLVPLPPAVLLLLPVLLLHDRGSSPTSSHLVVRHHVAWVGVCPHRGWRCPSVVHVPPWWWVGLHHGWRPPLHHVGAWPMALPVAGCALVAVRGGVVTLTILVLVVTTTTPIPAGTHTHTNTSPTGEYQQLSVKHTCTHTLSAA
jgi:hypothetical protein